jgi:hypothetical protein
MNNQMITTKEPDHYLSNWKKWRAILDRIISSPGYRHGHKNARLLLSLASFAMSQLGHYNTLHWKAVKQRSA